MKLIVTFFAIALSQFYLFGWGVTGHRVIGTIAEWHMTDAAKHRVMGVLQGATIAEVGNWMDDIKSDPTYDSLYNWHFVTIPDGLTYDQSEKHPNGDVIKGINFLIDALKTVDLKKEVEEAYLKMLIHMVADVHQPLHVGRPEDKGGNTIKVEWFWSKSNLHRVWDSGLIDSQQYSFSELAPIVNRGATNEKVFHWQNSSVVDWAHESMSYRKAIYNIPTDGKINYKYRFDHWDTVKLRLLQAGVRLAGILNEIYG
jgi:hypothetical protein